jgi:hypothetical protein
LTALSSRFEIARVRVVGTPSTMVGEAWRRISMLVRRAAAVTASSVMRVEAGWFCAEDLYVAAGELDEFVDQVGHFSEFFGCFCDDASALLCGYFGVEFEHVEVGSHGRQWCAQLV